MSSWIVFLILIGLSVADYLGIVQIDNWTLAIALLVTSSIQNFNSSMYYKDIERLQNQIDKLSSNK